MKKLLGSVIVATMALSMLTGTATAATLNVTVEKTAVAFTDAAPFVDENSRTLVPLRAIGEAMDVDVTWNEETKTATFTSLYEEGAENLSEDGAAYLGKVAVDFTVGSKTAAITYYYFALGSANDGEEASTINSEVTMDTAAVVKDSRTYAPVRYLAEAFGYNVAWNAETSTVAVDFEEVETEETTAPVTDETTAPTAPVTEETAPTAPVTEETAPTAPVTEETAPTVPVTDETAPTVPTPTAPAYQNVPDNDDGYDSL